LGSIANSIALVGFGLDSVIESISGLILIWRLRMHKGVSEHEEDQIEREALKYVTITFAMLGFYVIIESARKLIFVEIPEPSLYGMVIAILSIVIMPVLSLMKRDVGKQISSKALIADSEETLVCAVLSLALLIGLMGNYFFGFWQADPLVGFIIAVFLFREGWEWWKEAEE
jgi:divalent metal cation (Fe/Co/Zn/Cd) transporter